MMPFDPNIIRLEPNNWFSPVACYEGKARAQFEAPKGVVVGHGTFRCDELGSSKVEFTVEEIKTDERLPFGLAQLMTKKKLIEKDDKLTLQWGEFDNPCTHLQIETCGGSLFSTGETPCVEHRMSSNPKEKETLKFHLFLSQYEPRDAAEAMYWVVPLLNFDSEFYERHPDLNRHPLRIYPTPEIPSGLSGFDSRIANQRANEKNRLIVFEFNGGRGFIEPLPDYKERLKGLRDGHDRHRVTALMVGEIRSKPCGTFDELAEWFPFKLMPLLELATGGNIGFPWIELRDSGSNLVRRFHAEFPRPDYSKGHRPICELIHRGTGQLLTIAPSSPHFSATPLKVAIKHLIRGDFTSDLTIEDKISHISQALDNLCVLLKLKSLPPEDAISSVSSAQKQELGEIIASAQKAIHNLSDTAKREGHDSDGDVLKRIAGQVAGAKNLKVSFGKAVLRLLEKFNLPDGRILENHYKQNPRVDGRKWDAVLSFYRGVPIHSGAFSTRSGHHDPYDVMIVARHLQDILLRVIFKMLGYDGTYQPTVWESKGRARLDWVTSVASASQLGYGPRGTETTPSPVSIRISKNGEKE